ncbi:exonuclease domain-containing protein [Tautonia sp. JC769]|uniref:exonuclease domain-containing protein n=1 Tax=Tautonia sp. JC769 TaxID=3232135 RepID=UPI0034584915
MPGSRIGPFVAIDLETTGLIPGVDRIVEVGAVRFEADGTVRDRFARLVHPGRPMSPAAERIHGISDAMLADAEPREVVLPAFFDWLMGDRPHRVLAHHARFDAGFLGNELAAMGRPMPGVEVTDTLSLARCRLPKAASHRLDAVAELLGLSAGPAHRALADCERVRGLWVALDGEAGPHVRYPIADPVREQLIPCGWEGLSEAIAAGHRLVIRYEGGSRGSGPREITPRRLIHKGGAAYLVAFCHLERFEKAFRLDRVVSFDRIESARPVA